MSYQVSLALAESAAALHNITTTTTTTTFALPKLQSFFSLGDSYSAGIGATCTPWIKDAYDPDGSCLKCSGAYPYQILSIANTTSPSTSPSSSPTPSPNVHHLGCTGASLNDILAPSWTNRTSQLSMMAAVTTPAPWATLSIGGNDVGFAAIVANCIMMNTASCDAAMNTTESLLADPLLLEQLTATYLAVLATSPHAHFTLLVTSYARFFNAESEVCESKYFLRGRYLTRALRRRLNAMIADLNGVILVAVAVVQMQLVFGNSEKSIFYEDWDGLFEGRRFCEEAPMEWSGGWFFTVLGDDVLPDGTVVPVEGEQASGEKGEWDFERAEEGCGDGEGEETTLAYPWYVRKAMHPKSIAHWALGKQIYERWMSGEYS